MTGCDLPASAASASTPEQRVDVLIDIMNRRWLTRSDKRELAELWGVTFTTVSRYAAEAARRVRLSPEMVQQKRIEYIELQEGIAAEAMKARHYGDASRAIQAAAKLVGAEAPERHEVTGAGGGPLTILAAALPHLRAIEALDPPATAAELEHYAAAGGAGACAVDECRVHASGRAAALLGHGEGSAGR